MKKFSDIKLKGIKINYDPNNDPISITIFIPLDHVKNPARETISPEGGVTKEFIQNCVDKRRDFIRDWDEWKIKKIGIFDYKKHFWGSKNRLKYSADGGDQLTIEERGRNHMNRIIKDNIKKKRTIIGLNSIMNMVNLDFGHLHISELTLKHFQDMIYATSRTPKTISHRRSFLKDLITVAMTDGVITHNIFDGWEPIHLAENLSNYEKKAYTKEQLDYILKEAKKNKSYYPLFVFRCTTGMRPSEITGLKWKYVDLMQDQIHVKETLIEQDWSFTNSPKTKSGDRLIALNDYSREAIMEQKKITNYHDKESLVFQNPRATNKLKAWGGGSVIRQYDNIIKAVNSNPKLNIERLNPYQLRHTFASILWNNDQISIEDLQVLMGHEDIKTTMDNYVVKDKPITGINTDGINRILTVNSNNKPLH